MTVFVTIDPSVEILSYLNELGYKEFRNGQSTAILQILSGMYMYIYMYMFTILYYFVNIVIYVITHIYDP